MDEERRQAKKAKNKAIHKKKVAEKKEKAMAKRLQEEGYYDRGNVKIRTMNKKPHQIDDVKVKSKSNTLKMAPHR